MGTAPQRCPAHRSPTSVQSYVIASIPSEVLTQVGGKPGFMREVFRHDIRARKIPEEFFANKKKTRLQDANADGSGGITEILQDSGFTQQRTLEIYNELFHANVKDDNRFSHAILRGRSSLESAIGDGA